MSGVAVHTRRCSAHLLRNAAVTGNILQVHAYLLDPHASINDTLGDGWTALHHAIQHGQMDLFLHLLARTDVDVNAKTLCGTTPLALAMSRRNHSMAEALLLAGASKASIPRQDLILFRQTRNMPSSLRHKLSSRWSPVWTPEYHRRFPHPQRQVIYLILCANDARHHVRSWRRWVHLFLTSIWSPSSPRLPPACSWRYLSPPLLHLVFEFYGWID
ncbi:hypothetical protein H257_14896 [Aphanomyces astaci]|uniref:Uncharacterized protein n=1 Tax=Aphanomyces astaci TaxID=112090 RepID=W4FRG9_APHAT|nr:hypothetical protein H257_14896 [Aphanomyces astaci]ETV69258.1 hypothetical protein H257_14896 [Aphanomyces astaci]|eukprot:XP_009841115.1 hypothetical protein H257_14896 [Aphanomyces astaci]